MNRYESLVAKLKEWHDGMTADSPARQHLELILPSLRESDDERMTRAINNMLPFIPDKAYANNGVTKEGVLNWLEKHKGPKQDSITKYVYSKEDKKFIQDCANILVANDFATSAERLLSMFEQKPAWSEDDKRTVDAAIYWLERRLRIEKAYNISTEDSPLSMRNTAERLKSLRPQPHWKPSEEQMKALDKAILVCAGVAGKDEISPLISLYEELKKL